MVFFGGEILHCDDKEKTQCEIYKWLFLKKYLPYFEGKKVISI
jgi:hypothetical protein